jgi:hypothetical protein
MKISGGTGADISEALTLNEDIRWDEGFLRLD